MPLNEKHNKEVLINLIEKVSTSLESRISAYLIGGLAMGMYGLKESTKDVDLVFKTTKEASIFISMIEKMGYYRKLKLDIIYMDLGAHGIFTSDHGHNFDIFVEQVCKGLFLTEKMAKRARRIDIKGNLELFSISPEDIFLFKSITSRPGDLNDMFTLLPVNLDWSVIRSEIRDQPDYFKWIGAIYQRMGDLEEQFNVKIPIRKDIRKEAEISIISCSLIQILENRDLSIGEMEEMVDKEEISSLREAVEMLESMGYIRKTNMDKYCLLTRSS
jgi:hypothetical protein